MKRLAIIGFSALVTASCYFDNKEDLYQNFPDNCNTNAVSYATVVRPIVDQSCAYIGCHAGASPAAGLKLETYAELKVIADNGKLVGRITGTTGTVMPPTGPLNDCSIQQITAWVNQGAPEN
jgi:hypothetical protein